MIEYISPYFRPPSEGKSFILQATIGCSHNQCTFCAMYRREEQRFRMRPMDEIYSIIDYAYEKGMLRNRVFIADGNALVISTKKLLQIFDYLYAKNPDIERITMYANVSDVLRKSIDELKLLREKGLKMVYMGFESGNDEVLKRIEKGATYEESVRAAHKLKEAGIWNSVMVLLGVGGIELSEQHALNTGRLLTEADPEYVGVLSLQIRPQAPLYKEWLEGRFQLPDKFQMIKELEIIVKETELSNGYFFSNHISNYFPIKAKFPEEKKEVLEAIRFVLKSNNSQLLRPDFYRDVINQY